MLLWVDGRSKTSTRIQYWRFYKLANISLSCMQLRLCCSRETVTIMRDVKERKTERNKRKVFYEVILECFACIVNLRTRKCLSILLLVVVGGDKHWEGVGKRAEWSDIPRG